MQAVLYDLNRMPAFSKQGMGALPLPEFRARLHAGRLEVNLEFLQRLGIITELVKKYCEFELERFKIVNDLSEQGSMAAFGHTREALLDEERGILLNFVKRVDYSFFATRK